MAKGKYQQWLEPDGLILVEGWARDGLTKEQIANDKMHVAASTLYDWMSKYPEISEAIKKGSELPDYKMENALYQAGINGNVTAMIFWLKNRMPKKWKDKPVEDGLDDTASAKAAEVMSQVRELMRGDKQ